MLRITTAQTETELRWTLCGQLAGPWVGELRTCWDLSRRGAPRTRFVVDLREVTFVDESGETLLYEMCCAGAEFLAAGVETKHLVENLARE
jgi:hypothetical protein